MILLLRNWTQYLAYWLALIVLSLIAGSCESFVDVDLPSSQLTGETVFADAATADAALTSIYSKMRDDALTAGTPTGISALLGCYADELEYYAGSTLAANDFYLNSLLPSNVTVTSTWNSTYSLIYGANAVIEGVGASAGISAADRERLLGEAYFLRAYLHFYLVNLYGQVPYVVSTDYLSNSTIHKLSVGAVYEALTADLQQAAALLPEDYFGAERSRPNRSAAYSLLARAMLYTENWQEALQYSQAVTGNASLYAWVEDIDGVFLNTSTGTIWQLSAQFSGSNTLEAQTFIFTEGPPPAFSLRQDLVGSFETGDLRRSHWIATVTDGIQSWHHANKYKENGTTGSSVEYSILLRLEEQYLIQAEALARLNQLDSAKAALDRVRNRAGLGNTTAGTQAELASAILEERRKEFFTEQGHRWLDLKRTGTANAVLSVKKPGWDSKDVLWPLPENELLLNENLLPQNTGY